MNYSDLLANVWTVLTCQDTEKEGFPCICRNLRGKFMNYAVLPSVIFFFNAVILHTDKGLVNWNGNLLNMTQTFLSISHVCYAGLSFSCLKP